MWAPPHSGRSRWQTEQTVGFSNSSDKFGEPGVHLSAGNLHRELIDAFIMLFLQVMIYSTDVAREGSWTFDYKYFFSIKMDDV